MNTNYNKISGENLKNELNELKQEILNSREETSEAKEDIAEIKEEIKVKTPEKEDNPKKAIVLINKLNVRTAGSKSADIVGILNRSEEVTILSSKKTGWSKINAREDMSGYVMTEFLKEK